MPTGHLIVGLLGGLAAVAAALLAGLPIWVAAGLYVLVGNLCLVASLLAQMLADRMRRPPRRRAQGKRQGARRAPGMRPARAGH